MHAVPFFLVCLAQTGHGRRISARRHQLQSESYDESRTSLLTPIRPIPEGSAGRTLSPLETLAMLLQSFSSAAGYQPMVWSSSPRRYMCRGAVQMKAWCDEKGEPNTHIALKEEHQFSVKDKPGMAAYVGRPKTKAAAPAVILMHDWNGLSQSVIDKAQGLTDELGCVTVAFDCFRGNFTKLKVVCDYWDQMCHEERAHKYIDAVLEWCEAQPFIDNTKIAFLGVGWGCWHLFYYGAYKRPDITMVAVNGHPVTDSDALESMTGGLCILIAENDANVNHYERTAFYEALRQSELDKRVPVAVHFAENRERGYLQNMTQNRIKGTVEYEAWETVLGFLRQCWS